VHRRRILPRQPSAGKTNILAHETCRKSSAQVLARTSRTTATAACACVVASL
jgi:hypothetical protein